MWGANFFGGTLRGAKIFLVYAKGGPEKIDNQLPPMDSPLMALVIGILNSYLNSGSDLRPVFRFPEFDLFGAPAPGLPKFFINVS